jgi:uncharacterized protein YjbJ (UPF0337 family)
MNKDQVKGTIDDVAGRAKRQVGEWTGDTKAQVEGLGQQVKGKAEKAWGTAKDAVHDGKEQVKGEAKEAWKASGEKLRDERAEEERRRKAEQLRVQGDLDPAQQSESNDDVHEAEEIHHSHR